MIVCDEATKKLGLHRQDTRVIVQGFGNVGSYAAKLMCEAGYKVIGIAELDGGLYNPNGIDINALFAHKERNRSVQGFTGAEPHDPKELLVADCEILIPAATEAVITSRNAERIKAKILCEGANGPTTAAANATTACSGRRARWYW